MADQPLYYRDAVELAALIRAREISAREVMETHLGQIERVNPAVNAIVTLVAEKALAAAAAADGMTARGIETGPLHGLPIAHKDLVNTAGIRTTYGSPIYRDHVPTEDDLIVQRERAAGAITIGKTNTPEFGAGSQTFNRVFGATLNPYDTTRTCGGSSGGAAVSLACGMIPLADGSDTGGSLRNPANYCNVVGLRPSTGTVPGKPGGWTWLTVEGPMGRSSRDVALLLSVQAGFDPRSPVADNVSGARFRAPLDREFRGTRIGFSADLGGLPVEAEVARVVRESLGAFRTIGCDVEDATPDLANADRVFEVARAHEMATRREALVREHRDQVKETVIWNVEEGLRLTAGELREADRLRSELFVRMAAFFERYDYLVCPVSQAAPFSIDREYVDEIEGQQMSTYIEWMRSCSRISATAHPALSLPAGFTNEGLPAGIQIVGRFKDEFGLLQIGHALEGVLGAKSRWPVVASRV
ncbi:MAG: amidase [Dehalococcoidia bacterium]|nr:amidase [Dehalococcoidia bacterium]MCB9484875.1 amidase [Thermoflexaceae bacterium]